MSDILDVDNLRITSLNCYGLKTSLYQVYELCEISDIVFLQETLLFSHELSMLSTLHPEFEGMGVSAIDSTSGIITWQTIWRCSDFN